MKLAPLTFALAACLLFSAASADPQPVAEPLQPQIVAKEREGLEALKSGNLAAFAALTADDALLVDAQGVAMKAEVMKNVAGFKLVDFSMQDVRFVQISPASGLITYRLTETGTSHDKTFTAVAYISSVWAQRAGKWVCLFSQETGAK